MCEINKKDGLQITFDSDFSSKYKFSARNKH